MGQELSHSAASEQLEVDLGIKGPFFAPSAESASQSMQRIVCLIQQEWLLKQITGKFVSAQSSASGKQLTSEEKTDLLQPSFPHELNGWQRVAVLVIKKPLKKLQINKRHMEKDENSSLFYFLQQAAAKDKADSDEMINSKFSDKKFSKQIDDEFLCQETLCKIIEETCGLKVKEIADELSSASLPEFSQDDGNDQHADVISLSKQSHFVPLLLACQSSSFLYFFEPAQDYTLRDVLAFSPAIVSYSAAKYLFLFYQILKIFSMVQANGFSLSSSISFKDFYITNSMWISISRFSVDDSEVVSSEPNGLATAVDAWLVETPKLLTPPVLCNKKLQEYTTEWVNCELTTFDYLMILNTLAGRRMKDPSHYPIFPWVVDFTKRDCGYRDFTKSKYRLCKSDAQLDVTYHQPSNSRNDGIESVPHHISHDPLTSITYYVYLSRRISKETLCEHVRHRWVPDEYPSSMERLFAWTPEECIPDFYCDPMIFRSIHTDLPDLGIPSWTETPEDFIRYHRSVLESQFVSKNLNDWIDLVFGYKLSGMAAVDSKNVYLSLVDGHSHLTNCGVLQLFSRPHPTRKIQNLNQEVSFAKPCDLGAASDTSSVFVPNDADDTNADYITYIHGKVVEDDVNACKPTTLRRELWSIESAIDEASHIDEPRKAEDIEQDTRHKPSITLLPSGLRMKIDTLLEAASTESKVPLPDDLKIDSDGCSNFLCDLEAIEKELKFQCNIAPADSRGVNGFKFGSIFEGKKSGKKKSKNGLQVTASSRATLTLANILIELVLHEYVRLRTRTLTMEERLHENMLLLRANLHRFPSWLHAILESWLQPMDKLSKDDIEDDVIVNRLLRHPDLLLHQFHNPLPHPKYFPSLHNLLTNLFEFNGPINGSSVKVDKYSFGAISTGNRTPGSNNISRAAHFLPQLIEELDKEGIHLLLTFLLPLFSSPDTKLYAFLNFFHPLGIVMGFRSSLKYFFHELQKLYGTGSEISPIESKLLDQKFISKVIIVFGLKCFLDCFLQYVIDGLFEVNENECSKEKNDNDNFDSESNEFQSDKLSRIYLENAKEEGTETTEDRESFEMEREISDDSIPDRKESIDYMEDEDNVNFFGPKSLSGKKLGESGVFTRLEAIIEDDRPISITDNNSHRDLENIKSIRPEISEPTHCLNPLPDDGVSAVSEEDDDNKMHRFVKVLDKSEVIFSNSSHQFAGSTALINCGKSHPLNSGKDSSHFVRPDSDEEIHSVDFTTNSSSNTEPSDSFVKGSALSESVKKDVFTHSLAQNQSLNENYSEMEDSSSTDPNDQGSSTDELPVATEDFGIDSVLSEDSNKSYLIRRSSVKMRSGHSGSSPFMLLDSNEDCSDQENVIEKPSDDYILEDYANLQVDRITDSEELDSIAHGVSSEEIIDTGSSAQELAFSSLKWIMPSLGPVLTSKYVVHLILKRFPKVWLNVKYLELTATDLILAFKSKGKFLMDCLIEAVGIYGSAVIFHQFIPFASRSVFSALKANSVSTYAEGQLFCSLQVISRTVVHLSSADLADKIEILSQEIFEPLLRLLSSSKAFSSGSKVRSALLYSLVDLLAILSQKLGQLNARDAMKPLLQRFFSCFDGVYRLERKHGSCSAVLRKYSFAVGNGCDNDSTVSFEEDTPVQGDETFESSTGDSSKVKANSETVLTGGEVSRPEGKQKLSLDATGNQVLQQDVTESDSSTLKDIDHAIGSQSYSTVSNPEDKVLDAEEFAPSLISEAEDAKQMDEKTLKGLNQYKDLCDSFTTHLAHYSYVLFCRVLGDHFVSGNLYNEELIWQLCSNFDEGLTLTTNTEATDADVVHQEDSKSAKKRQDEDRAKDALPESAKKFTRKMTFSDNEEDAPVFRSMWQHIEGDWLQMWKERLDTKGDDSTPVLRGRRLQTYAGHSAAVRDIYIPDSEHYFLSASRDKTVKLWLLKNHGNGTAQMGCGKTYDKHTKPVFAIQSIESKSFAVSCDGTVHVWDPMKSATISQLDLGKSHSIVSIRTLPAPSTTVALASSEGTLRLYDVRQRSVSDEWKLLSTSTAGNVKCLCTNEEGTWIAAGFSSGSISMLDLRTGMLRGQWKAHEAEILQMEAYKDHNILSTANDLRLKMWNDDGSLFLRFKSPPDPVHYISLCRDQCVWASANGNRIGITHHVTNWSNYKSKRLPQELFKGTISKLKALPVNQLYLVGSENGNVVLFD